MTRLRYVSLNLFLNMKVITVEIEKLDCTGPSVHRSLLKSFALIFRLFCEHMERPDSCPLMKLGLYGVYGFISRMFRLGYVLTCVTE